MIDRWNVHKLINSSIFIHTFIPSFGAGIKTYLLGTNAPPSLGAERR